MSQHRKLKSFHKISTPLTIIPSNNNESFRHSHLRYKVCDHNESSSTSGTASCSLTPSSMGRKSLSSFASKSEMSHGSAHQQDSFVGFSPTGLSSMCNSNMRQGTKNISRRLSRFNIRSARTKALIDGSDSDGSTEARKHYPRSNYIPRTAPCTPRARDIEDSAPEFPEPTGSPQIHVSPTISMPPPSPQISENYTLSSSISCRDDDKRMARAHRLKLAGIAERQYWITCINNEAARYGSKSVRVAQGLCNLGNALLNCKEYTESLSAYKKAVRILREKCGNNNLFVACALDKVGYVASMIPTDQNLNWALMALHEALVMRYAHLGPHHCDVVDTLNKIAGIHLHKRDWVEARNAYVEVLTVRAAIFGRNHPSIAVTAQTLGRVYTSLGEFELALKHMELALKLFREKPMSMKDNHPLVVKLLKNITTTSRLMTSLGRRRLAV